MAISISVSTSPKSWGCGGIFKPVTPSALVLAPLVLWLLWFLWHVSEVELSFILPFVALDLSTNTGNCCQDNYCYLFFNRERKMNQQQGGGPAGLLQRLMCCSSWLLPPLESFGLCFGYVHQSGKNIKIRQHLVAVAGEKWQPGGISLARTTCNLWFSDGQ